MKGFVGKFMMTLIMLGLFSLLYTALNETMSPLQTFATAQITDADSIETMNLLNTMWTWIVVAVAFSFVVWVIFTARREKEVRFV